MKLYNGIHIKHFFYGNKKRSLIFYIKINRSTNFEKDLILKILYFFLEKVFQVNRIVK